MKNTVVKKKYFFFFSFLLFLLHLPFSIAHAVITDGSGFTARVPYKGFAILNLDSFDELYDSLQLKITGLSRSAYDFAIAGWQYLLFNDSLRREHLLSVIDFSLPSNRERLFVIDLLQRKLVFHTYVSHGQGSGDLFARDFSNQPNSNKSSLGFYSTEETYIGRHGYSLKLKGLELGVNDLAAERSIVMHPASYAGKTYLMRKGSLGRSHGCPAIPENISRSLINTIREGSCLFIYGPNSQYLQRSLVLNPHLRSN